MKRFLGPFSLLLCLHFLLGEAELLIQDEDLTFKTHDLDRQLRPFRLSSFVLPLTFVSNQSSPCSFVVPSPEEYSQKRMTLVLWEQAKEAGCLTYADFLREVDEALSPLAILITSSNPDFDTISTWTTPFIEPIGEKVITQAKKVQISSQTGILLSNFTGLVVLLPVGNARLIFFESTGWKALNWTLFSLWTVIFCYAIVQLIYFFVMNQKWGYNTRLVVFSAGAYTCFMRMLECAVDPWESTLKLGVLGHSFVWWTTFLGGYFALLSILLAWVMVVRADTIISGKSAKVITYVLHSMTVFATISLLLIAFAMPYLSLSPTLAILITVTYVLLIPFSFIMGGIFLYFGVSLLTSLKRIDFHGNKSKENLVRKTTWLLISCILGFLMAIAVLIGINVVGFTNQALSNLPGFIVVVRIVFDLLLMEMLATMFLTLTFKGFAAKLVSVATNVISTEGGAKREGLTSEAPTEGRRSEIEHGSSLQMNAME